MSALSISLLARKGGVGRTTTTLNLAGAFAEDSLRVLCLDLDGQASLSRAIFGSQHVETTHEANTVAALFSGCDPEPRDIIQTTPFDGISLVAASDGLEAFSIPARDAGDRQWALHNFIHEVQDDFDIILIDTGPNTTVLPAWAALVASDFVLSPVLADSFGTQSVISVQRHVEEVQRGPNKNVRILGYMLNMLQKNAVCQAYELTLRQLHGPQVFETTLPLMAAFREAIAERSPITIHKPRCKAAKLIRQLAEEITDRIVTKANRKNAA